MLQLGTRADKQSKVSSNYSSKNKMDLLNEKGALRPLNQYRNGWSVIQYQTSVLLLKEHRLISVPLVKESKRY